MRGGGSEKRSDLSEPTPGVQPVPQVHTSRGQSLPRQVRLSLHSLKATASGASPHPPKSFQCLPIPHAPPPLPILSRALLLVQLFIFKGDFRSKYLWQNTERASFHWGRVRSASPARALDSQICVGRRRPLAAGPGHWHPHTHTHTQALGAQQGSREAFPSSTWALTLPPAASASGVGPGKGPCMGGTSRPGETHSGSPWKPGTPIHQLCDLQQMDPDKPASSAGKWGQ